MGYCEWTPVESKYLIICDVFLLFNIKIIKWKTYQLCIHPFRLLVMESSSDLVYLLMNSIISIQVTQSKANVVPMLLDILCWTAHVPVHTDVV